MTHSSVAFALPVSSSPCEPSCNKHPDATEEQIRAGLNGNICRCGTYANVLQAVISLVKGNQHG